MSLNTTDGSSSEDEIYFGKITLKEVKKRLGWHNQWQTCTVSASNSPRKCENLDKSLNLLQTCSEPNLIYRKDILNQNTENRNSYWNISEDDSFIKMENMVEKLCKSPTLEKLKKTEELNNTLEVIEYILNNPPSGDIKTTVVTGNEDKNIKPVGKSNDEVLKEICFKKLQNISPQKTRPVEKAIALEPVQCTPVKMENKGMVFKTPVNTKPIPTFKTPAQPLSIIKPTSTLKKTPSKSNAYQHISSPVASYIKNCPIAPLVRDVHPKKPLSGLSYIPKLKNHTPVASGNKENINLPPVAYKSAKNMKIIDLSDEQRLPQCKWAMKMMPPLQKPLVVKHDHRELNIAKRKLPPQQQDSYADISDHQAEVSICIQKSAFKNHNIK